jgi:hypothetical protein
MATRAEVEKLALDLPETERAIRTNVFLYRRIQRRDSGIVGESLALKRASIWSFHLID